jgi:Holliday junction DNA helicase RuvA
MILSSVGPTEIRKVIALGDLVTLQRIKGIGAKTAQRILVDLQDKFSKSLAEGAGTGLQPRLPATETSEALTALLTLGFNRSAAEKALKQAEKNLGPEKSVEELIKVALNHI